MLKHHFEDGTTRLGEDAAELMCKYVDTFVREAIARARFEKEEGGEGGVGRGGDFLEVCSCRKWETEGNAY